jgi:hypothetical protein
LSIGVVLAAGQTLRSQGPSAGARPWTPFRTADGQPDKVSTAPWTIEFPFVRDNEYRMFEHGCHEGNHAIENMLRGARAEERR